MKLSKWYLEAADSAQAERITHLEIGRASIISRRVKAKAEYRLRMRVLDRQMLRVNTGLREVAREISAECMQERDYEEWAAHDKQEEDWGAYAKELTAMDVAMCHNIALVDHEEWTAGRRREEVDGAATYRLDRVQLTPKQRKAKTEGSRSTLGAGLGTGLSASASPGSLGQQMGRVFLDIAKVDEEQPY